MKYKFIWPGVLTVFEYWRHWMGVPLECLSGLEPEWEGLEYCDGWNATFWWVVNHGWYRMNNKMTSTSEVGSYEEPNDFYYKV